MVEDGSSEVRSSEASTYLGRNTAIDYSRLLACIMRFSLA